MVYFCNSGSEANDLAMLMARAYTGYLNIVGKEEEPILLDCFTIHLNLIKKII